MSDFEGLTPEQKTFFEENGYLVIENFASSDQIKELMTRMNNLLEKFEPKTISLFSTKNQKETSNDYFLQSGGNISFFFEEKAFDKEGTLLQPKSLSINKVGHALHDLDPAFREFSRTEKIKKILKSLNYHSPLPIQSMYIFKQPGIGGEVIPHQDSSFLYTEPLSCLGLWFALEDANLENGCLWALHGSHKNALSRRFLSDGEKVFFNTSEIPTYEFSKFIPIPVKAGSVVILHGLLVHNSYENKSPKSRHAYSVHFIETKNCEYASDNWLQRRKSTDPPLQPLYTSN